MNRNTKDCPHSYPTRSIEQVPMADIRREIYSPLFMEPEYSLPCSQEFSSVTQSQSTSFHRIFLKTVVIPMLNYVIKHYAMKAHREMTV
jgi:hypothetical protein